MFSFQWHDMKLNRQVWMCKTYISSGLGHTPQSYVPLDLCVVGMFDHRNFVYIYSFRYFKLIECTIFIFFFSVGPICLCTNTQTNTYWCLRTVNETHNFLYCEFVDSFLSFYNFIKDPHQVWILCFIAYCTISLLKFSIKTSFPDGR